MNRYLELVKEFHDSIDVVTPDNPAPDNEEFDTRRLRITLLFEELHELAIATGTERSFQKLCKEVARKHDVYDNAFKDTQEELDALCDLQVVLSGKILTSGFANCFDEAFEEVCRSNMSKTIPVEEASSELVHKHVKKLSQEKQVEVTPKTSSDGKRVMFRRVTDNKLLKGPLFEEPKLWPIIRNALNF